MKPSSLAIALAALMCIASVGSIAARPGAKVQHSISLKDVIPMEFGDWAIAPDQGAQIVDPTTQKTIETIYSQVVTRTYLNKNGYRIMLSVAYGDDQRGGLQAHKPEVCYPAQGFQVRDLTEGTVATSFGPIDVKRMDASLRTRNEPVTYWLTVGDQVIRNKFDKRLAQIRLALTGQIPDGLLFRISSIDNDSSRAFREQEKFANDMMNAVPPAARRQLGGLSDSTKTSS